MRLEVRRPGLVEFQEAWDLQRELVERVTPGRGFLLLLEHPPVITLGRNGDPANVVEARGMPVHRIDRGGDATVHSPGQLVGYPIMDVRRWGVRRFVSRIERSLVELLAAFGLEGRPREGTAGVWTAGGKIASIGLRFRRGVSTHGFALNVCNDLSLFGAIHPCGRAGERMTSMSVERGRDVTVAEAADRFCLQGRE